MCRNIKTLFNFAPPATDEEIGAASLQFVRKLSGFNKPSEANALAFAKAVEDVAAVARTLIDSLSTTAPPRDRGVEAAKARAKARRRRLGYSVLLHLRHPSARPNNPGTQRKRTNAPR